MRSGTLEPVSLEIGEQRRSCLEDGVGDDDDGEGKDEGDDGCEEDDEGDEPKDGGKD